MDNNLIYDSCVDINDNLTPANNVNRIPFKIIIDDEEIVDNDLDTSKLLEKMKASKGSIGSACPSPDDFMKMFEKYKNTFCVTISAALSGSYNSAMLAKSMIEEKLPEKFVHVFDSESAAAGEALVALKVKQLIEQNLNPTEIVEITNKYIAKLKTFFILDSLDNLVKNGRIHNAKAMIASILHIVPIMGDDGHGEIKMVEKVRGKKRAYNRLVDMIGECDVDFENTILGITHSNAYERAVELKKEIMKRYPFKDIVIFKATGLSTVYADDGGIVVAF